MNKNLQEQRKSASLLSKGDSSFEIKNKIIALIKEQEILQNANVIDIGCGTGTLLKALHEIEPKWNLSGWDLTAFTLDFPFTFASYDLNQDFAQNKNQYDLIISSEVIEHLENPRHFVRQIAQILKAGGYAIISTPNIENIKNQMAMFFKGYYSDFGPQNYPAHITALSLFDFSNIVKEVPELKLLETHYTNSGRIPGTGFKWQTFFPFLKGKRFSDNIIFVLTKN